MKILVLGSGAGGGYPQWNCNCERCGGLRRGTIRAHPRTQSSIAVSDGTGQWVLLNASPDIGHQLRSNPALHPRNGKRDTPIKAVILMDAQLDHVVGLLSLREGPPIELYCTPCVFEELTGGLPILPILQHYCGIRWHLLAVAGETTTVEFRLEALPTLRFSAIAIPGKAPPYSAHREDPSVGDNLALLIEDQESGERVFYAPGLSQVGKAERQWMKQASCIMVDGTFWSEHEMADAGLGHKSASDMGHLPQDGPEGMIAALSRLKARRKVLIHINNSNPILDEDSVQRRELEGHGIEVAYDGMEIEL